MNCTKGHESIDDQLQRYKIDNHNKFLYKKSCITNDDKVINENVNVNFKDDVSNYTAVTKGGNMRTPFQEEIKMKHAWPNGTTVITGDSILNNLEEYRLNKRFNVKVRPFPGADVDDMPLLQERPDNIILHIGINDTPNKTSTEILNEIAELKLYIESILPHVNIYLSCPVLRTDNAKAGFTIHHLRQKMKAFQKY